ncbi:MAG: APC family permease [Gemmatimonadales bacterium]|nr:APC family permease [Gemmatimonadales bacterium]
MSATDRPELVRSIGRWGLTALVINGIIGSSIYGLPSTVSATLGAAAPWAWAAAALLIGVIPACFAEVASRFRDAGGPYLYVRQTFGPYAGLQTGWMAYLARLTASASNANLFVIYLGEFAPGMTGGMRNAVVLTVLLGGLCAVNSRGVGEGSKVSGLLASAKLGIFLASIVSAAVGVTLLAAMSRRVVPPVAA